jgi:hypothetical protein
MLGIVFDGENPSINKIVLKAKMDYRTVGKVINNLKKRGIVNKSLFVLISSCVYTSLKIKVVMHVIFPIEY